MGFEQLIQKVRQAEDALESRERAVAAHLRHAKASWRSAWTPGRIVVAGLACGFLVGRARPLRLAADGGQWMSWLSLLPGLLDGSAQATTPHTDADADAGTDTDTDTSTESGAAADPARTVPPDTHL